MENGGMNMIDLDSFILSLKAAWMNRFSCNRDWPYLPKYYLNKIAPCSLLLRMNFEQYSELPCIKTIPMFYQEVVLAYCKSNTTEPIESKQCFC